MRRPLSLLALPAAMLGLAAALAGPVMAQSLDGEPPAQAAAAAPRGNPLWGIPLQSLTATRERPLFSPSRRPPPSAAPAPAAVAPLAESAPAPAPRPPLALIGTVVGAKEGFGIFLDQTSNTVMRLRTGDVHRGWTLKQVTVRGVLLQMDRRSAELALPPPEKGAMPAQSGGRRRTAERPFPNEPDPSSH